MIVIYVGTNHILEMFFFKEKSEAEDSSEDLLTNFNHSIPSSCEDMHQ